MHSRRCFGPTAVLPESIHILLLRRGDKRVKTPAVLLFRIIKKANIYC